MRTSRIRMLGYLLAAIGVIFFVVAGIAYMKVQDGYQALDRFSEAQDVRLTYNDEGQLIDRGTTEGADAIMALLTEDWGFVPNEGDFDADDPVVNTASEFMYQMATVGYHVLHGTQTVVLTEDAEYNGEAFPAGTYEFEVDGRYYSQFDRSHPIEGVARGQAWSGTVLGLFSQLGVGTTTHYTLQLSLGIAALFGALGGTMLITGLGLLWASRPEKAATA